ncbi:MAG TPA: SDR family NAD(P)-dependent oxidoreductase [Chloroflexota bacterium]|jgi:3-oxoacyl-[acyl-carrier protein] reductase
MSERGSAGGERPVALLVGGGAGIGAATAARLGRAGYALAVADLAVERARAVVDDLERAGAPALALAVDATDEAQVQATVDETFARFGRIDGLVTTVGGSRPLLVSDMSLAEWNKMLTVNLTSQFLTARAVLPTMQRQRGGSIVALSSGQAWGEARRADYAAAKNGIIGFVRSLALEVARDGIRVNAVAPGMTLTERVLNMMGPEEITQRTSRIPLGRAAEPADLADVIAWFLSPESRYVTGQVLLVNGGSLLR